MLNAATWAVAQAIKVLGIVGCWMLFKWMVSTGSETMRDILEAISMALQAGCLKIKRIAWNHIRKEKEPVTTEGTVE